LLEDVTWRPTEELAEAAPVSDVDRDPITALNRVGPRSIEPDDLANVRQQR